MFDVRENLKKIGIVALIVLVSVVVFFVAKSCYVDTYTIEGTVKAKFIDNSKEGSAYVVILKDNTKLEVKRNWWYWGSQYNEDVNYANIVVNGTYRFTCWGWQLDAFGTYWYPNIIQVEEIS